MPQYSEFLGEIVWENSLRSRQNPTGGTISDGRLFVGTTQKWIMVYDATTGKRLDRTWADVPIHIAPTVDDSLIFYSGVGDWNIMATADIFKGKVLWSRTAQSAGSDIIAMDTIVYFATRPGGIYSIRQSDGEILSRKQLGVGVSCNMVIFGDRLFVGLRDGKIMVLDRDDLNTLQEIRLESPVAEGFTEFGGRLYANLENGDLVIIDPRAMEIMQTIEQEGHFDTAPLILKNLIFTVNNAGVLTSYTLQEPYRQVWQRKLEELPAIDRDKEAGYALSGEASVFASPVEISGQLVVLTYRGSLFVIEPQTSRIDIRKKLEGRFIRTPLVHSGMAFIFSETSKIIALR